MRTLMIWTLIVSTSVLPSAIAADNGKTVQPAKLANVELNEDGFVVGMLVRKDGTPVAGKELDVRTKTTAAKVVTDRAGRFKIASKSSSNCAVIVDGKAHACRLWKHNSAPANSLTSLGVVYGGGELARGQFGGCAEGCEDGGGRFGTIGGVSGGQLLGLGLLAGAVVAIVIAANNDDDDAS